MIDDHETNLLDQKDKHRAQMLEFLARDVQDARENTSLILGFKVEPRHDVFCERKANLCGVFLVVDNAVMFMHNETVIHCLFRDSKWE